MKSHVSKPRSHRRRHRSLQTSVTKTSILIAISILTPTFLITSLHAPLIRHAAVILVIIAYAFSMLGIEFNQMSRQIVNTLVPAASWYLWLLHGFLLHVADATFKNTHHHVTSLPRQPEMSAIAWVLNVTFSAIAIAAVASTRWTGRPVYLFVRTAVPAYFALAILTSKALAAISSLRWLGVGVTVFIFASYVMSFRVEDTLVYFVAIHHLLLVPVGLAIVAAAVEIAILYMWDGKTPRRELDGIPEFNATSDQTSLTPPTSSERQSSPLRDVLRRAVRTTRPDVPPTIALPVATKPDAKECDVGIEQPSDVGETVIDRSPPQMDVERGHVFTDGCKCPSCTEHLRNFFN